MFHVSCFMCGFSVGALPPRVYVGHSIYKGKAALTITPRPPEFMPLDVSMTVLDKRLLFRDMQFSTNCCQIEVITL